MMLSLPAAAVTFTPIAILDQRAYCHAAMQDRSINLPPSTIKPETEIVHAATVYVAGEFVGTLYRTRSGATYLYLGEIGRKRSPNDRAAEHAAELLKAQATGGFQRIPKPALPIEDLTIQGCF